MFLAGGRSDAEFGMAFVKNRMDDLIRDALDGSLIRLSQRSCLFARRGLGSPEDFASWDPPAYQ